MKKVLIIIFIFSITLVSTALYFYNYIYNNPISIKKVLEIKKGETVNEILNKIGGLNKNIIKLYLKITGLDSEIKTGHYTFKGNKITIDKLIKKFVSGEVSVVRVSIPEGYTVNQIVNLLEKNNLIKKDDFYKKLNEMKNVGLFTKTNDYEGYFFPDTYYFYLGESSTEIIEQFFNRFKEKTSNYRNMFTKKEFYNKLILASIIEKEAYYNKEKPIMASVFYNRLKINMKLQSCATVEFLYNYKKKKLYYKDLKIKSKYNTYLYNGLPYGAISNPGIKSIEAAIFPKETSYYYFRLGEERHHIFSEKFYRRGSFNGNN
ncbi:endolytic transglycosylase MltG [Haliovirga abyssi]|uniref:Endolytic murein transglycosylase n=1 Tax=Haliovirga abyssi TaxID=2996794 RepID=A0AAU9D9K2_9FUSO|nr:endolytic transglycosylase MltG [Haliovirga abyssi]BDU49975.1 cell division protein YceG [Haliovirga abyssi]